VVGDDDRVGVRRALTVARGSSRLPFALGGAVSDGKDLRLTELSGNFTESLRGLAVTEGRGLGGQAIALRRPVAVTDYQASRSISHHFDHAVRVEGLHAAVAVPVIVGRTIRAVLYGAAREVVRFGSGSIGALVQTARDLEQEFAVRDAVERRMATLTALTKEAAADRDTIRRGYAELREISHRITDETLRLQLDRVCATLSRGTVAATPGGATPTLSLRELDVLTCVAAGQTNAETAATLRLSSETVKSYLRSAMRKLDSRTRIQAVNAARRAGLLP